MKRRDFMALGSAIVVAPRDVAAETPRLVSLTAGSPIPIDSPNASIFLSALAQHGYSIGRNLEYQPYGAAAMLRANCGSSEIMAKATEAASSSVLATHGISLHRQRILV